jgi:hypothetical protein
MYMYIYIYIYIYILFARRQNPLQPELLVLLKNIFRLGGTNKINIWTGRIDS